jgi:hypothetical protein
MLISYLSFVRACYLRAADDGDVRSVNPGDAAERLYQAGARRFALGFAS